MSISSRVSDIAAPGEWDTPPTYDRKDQGDYLPDNNTFRPLKIFPTLRNGEDFDSWLINLAVGVPRWPHRQRAPKARSIVPTLQKLEDAFQKGCLLAAQCNVPGNLPNHRWSRPSSRTGRRLHVRCQDGVCGTWHSRLYEKTG